MVRARKCPELSSKNRFPKAEKTVRISFRAVFWFLVRLVVGSALVIGGFVVAFQDAFIFVGAGFPDPLKPQDIRERKPEQIPPHVTPYWIKTADGETLEAWHYVPEGELRPEFALLFHGNASQVESEYGYQRWFGSLGIQSVSFSYRGYGRSTGYPSEAGVYRDVDAVWAFVQSNLGVRADNAIAYGVSLGTGPASYFAKTYRPKALILLAAFSSIDQVVSERRGYSLLKPFLWTHFPVAENISEFRSCVIAAHGERDEIIRYSHLADIRKAQSGNPDFHMISSPTAMHNDLFDIIRPELKKILLECLESSLANSTHAE